MLRSSNIYEDLAPRDHLINHVDMVVSLFLGGGTTLNEKLV